MISRIKKDDIKDYRPKLTLAARDSLIDLAGSLKFIVTRKGTYDGYPSVPELLESLAAAYRRDPAGVKLAFKVLGVTPSGEASFTLDEPADPDA